MFSFASHILTHTSAGDLTRRVGAFEMRPNRDPFVIADRLWVKGHSTPTRRNCASQTRRGLGSRVFIGAQPGNPVFSELCFASGLVTSEHGCSLSWRRLPQLRQAAAGLKQVAP